MKTILKFYSPTCGPCKAMAKNLESIEDAIILDMDVTNIDNQDSINQYNVRSVPTTVILGDDGNVVETLKGVVATDRIKELLNE